MKGLIIIPEFNDDKSKCSLSAAVKKAIVQGQVVTGHPSNQGDRWQVISAKSVQLKVTKETGRSRCR